MILATKTSDQARQRGHTLSTYLYNSYLSPEYLVLPFILDVKFVGRTSRGHRRYFQHAHFIPIVGVGKRGEY